MHFEARLPSNGARRPSWEDRSYESDGRMRYLVPRVRFPGAHILLILLPLLCLVVVVEDAELNLEIVARM